MPGSWRTLHPQYIISFQVSLHKERGRRSKLDFLQDNAKPLTASITKHGFSWGPGAELARLQSRTVTHLKYLANHEMKNMTKKSRTVKQLQSYIRGIQQETLFLTQNFRNWSPQFPNIHGCLLELKKGQTLLCPNFLKIHCRHQLKNYLTFVLKIDSFFLFLFTLIQNPIFFFLFK